MADRPLTSAKEKHMSAHRSYRDLRVVTLTGGTGGNNLVHGFRELAIGKLTTLYTVCDNGGSTGTLRTEHGILPVGDARRLIHALMDPKHKLAPFMDFRFPDDGSVFAGHSLMNIVLSAAERMFGRSGGPQYVADALGCRGEVYPISTQDCHLIAELSDGREIVGETLIDTRSIRDERFISRVYLDREAYICAEADRALREADIIVLGPGDLYTSIAPILLVRGVAEALRESRATIVYVVNLMTKYSETRGFSAKDFAELLLKRYGIGRPKFDAVLIHDGKRHPLPGGLLRKYYEEERAEPVVLNSDEYEKLFSITHRVVSGDFVSEGALKQRLIHHDGTKLARAVMGLMEPNLPEDPRILVFDIDDTLVNSTKDLRGDMFRIGALTAVSGAREFLDRSSHAGHRCVVLTAGEADYQRTKLEVAGLAHLCPEVIVVEEPEHKLAALQRIIKDAGVPPEHVIVIGDRPDTELFYGQELGCKVVRINLPHGRHAGTHRVPAPDMSVDNFHDLDLSKLY